VDWTRILAEAGTPEPPGRAETLAALKASREAKASQALEAKAEKAAAKAAKPVKAGMSLRARKKYL